MGIPANELAAIRATVEAFLPDTCTNSRTGATLPCKIRADNGRVFLQGMPRFLQLPRWIVTVPDSADVAIGDALTTSFGTYISIHTDSPADTSLSTVLRAIKANATVTFQRGTEALASVPALISTTQPDSGLQPTSATFRWLFIIPGGYLYGDGTPITDGDLLVWSGLGTLSDGTTRSLPIRYVVPVVGSGSGPNAMYSAYVEEAL